MKSKVDLRQKLRRGFMSIPIAAVIPIQFFGSIPLQLYMANAGEMKIPQSAVLLYCTAFFVLSLTALTLVGFVLSDKVFSCYCAGLFAGGLLLYLQSNFLFIDVGILNGQEFALSSYQGRMWINLFLWITVLAMAIFCILKFPKFLNKVIKYGSLALSAMQCIVIVLLLIMPGQAEKNSDIIVTTKGFNELSSDKNVVMIIMDMFDDTYMTEVLEKNPDIADHLDGFVRYTNITGKYSSTSYGVPYLITQHPLLNQGGNYRAMLEQAYDNSEQLNQLMQNGYRIQLYTDKILISDVFSNNCYNITSDDVYFVSDSFYFFQLMINLTLLRGAPDLLKNQLHLSTDQFDQAVSAKNNEAHTTTGILPYQKMLNNPIQTVEKPIFSVIHIRGAHYPYEINENAELVETNSVTYYEQSVGTIRAVLAYLDHMREAGVYDNSTIILTADHGYYNNGALTSPALLVKTKNCRGELAFDNSPVSHDNIQDFILGDVGIDYHPISKIGQRTFYSYIFSAANYFPLTEWYVSDKSNKLESFTPSGFQIGTDGNKVPLSKYIAYQFGDILYFGINGKANSYFDYGLGNADDTGTKLLGSESKLTLSHESISQNMLLAIEFENAQDSGITITAICNGTDCGTITLEPGQSLAQWKIPEGNLNKGQSELVLRYVGLDQDWCGVAQNLSYKSWKINEYNGTGSFASAYTVSALEDYQAQILSYEISGYDLLVQVKNTSSVNWNYQDRIRCCIKVNGGDIGFVRAELDPERTVKPGEEVTFCFENLGRGIFSTDNYFTDNLVEVQMLQEGFAYFGDTMKVDAVRQRIGE